MPTANEPLQGRRILVVEDEALVAEEVRDRLTRIGYEIVAVADTGEAAIDIAEATRPDLVLMDIRLKGKLDGIEAGDRIYQSLNLPIVFVTAHSDHATLQRVKTNTTFGYVLKPFQERDLVMAIDMAMHRHSVEKHLKESELTHAALLAGITDGVIATDRHGRIRFLNPVAENITGCRIEEVHGVPLDEVLRLIDESTLAPAGNPLERVLSGRARMEPGPAMLMLDGEGRRIPVEIAAAPVMYAGMLTGAVLTFRNLSERRRAEMRFRGLLEASPDAMLIVDGGGIILLVNAQTEKLFGYGRDELLGRPVEMLMPDHHRERHREHRGGFLKKPLPRPMAPAMELFGLHKTGRLVPIEVTLGPLESEDGMMISSAIRDITVRVAEHRKLRDSEEKLRGLYELSPLGIVMTDDSGRFVEFNEAFRRICGYGAEELKALDFRALTPERFAAEEARQQELLRSTGRYGPYEKEYIRKDGSCVPIRLNGMLISNEGGGRLTWSIVEDITVRKLAEEARLRLEEQLRQSRKMEAIGTLAGGIAHDFNNILSAIIGNVELVRMDVEEGHPAQVSLGEIRMASDRARDLVKQILAFSRRLPQERAPVDLRQVVNESLGMLRSGIPAGVEIASHLSLDVPPVLADRTQMHQVVINLCTNAWQAMGEHSGRIVIDIGEVTLEEALPASPQLAPGRYVLLSVADNAGGMDPATAERVFDPFFTTKEVGEGTGLGLAVVHGIVQSHGGAIVLDTVPGQGTTFRLYLPTTDAAQERPEVVPVAPVHDRGAHILYLDDETALVSMVTRTLERAGYIVDGFSVPQEAIDALSGNAARYAFVLLDYNMPGISGLGVAGKVLRLRPDMPVAITSGYVTDDLRAEAAVLGVCEVIDKPSLMKELPVIINRWVGKPAG